MNLYLINDVGNGRIGSESNGHIGQQISYVIAASGLFWSSPAVAAKDDKPK